MTFSHELLSPHRFGELKTVKKDPKKSKNPRKTTTWTYDYLNEDEPDLVFVFYIRSDRASLGSTPFQPQRVRS